MGKFEKLVVLTVLFVAAIVLAISFNRGSDTVEASDPLSGARELLDQEGLGARELESTPQAPVTPPATGEETTGRLDDESAPSLLLNAGTDAAPAGLRPTTPPSSALSVAPASDPSRRILGDATGLRPSFLDEYMRYTVVEGDTWSSLAQRFYQDGQYTRNLHIANEGMSELVPGAEVLVPVFDLLALEGGAETPAASEASLSFAPAPGAAPLGSGTAPAPRSVPAPSAAGAKLAEYEVRPGDTLSDISLAVFGTATRWKEILDVNGDKLAKPESLQVGMKLKIPAGGKVPAAAPAKSEAKKDAPKPKTAQADGKPATATKKKKVL